MLNKQLAPLPQVLSFPFSWWVWLFSILIWGFSKLRWLTAKTSTPYLPKNHINLSTLLRTAGPWRTLLRQQPQKCLPSFSMMSKALFFEMYKRIAKLKEHFQLKAIASNGKLIPCLDTFGTYLGNGKVKVTGKGVSSSHSEPTQSRTSPRRCRFSLSLPPSLTCKVPSGLAGASQQSWALTHSRPIFWLTSPIGDHSWAWYCETQWRHRSNEATQWKSFIPKL